MKRIFGIFMMIAFALIGGANAVPNSNTPGFASQYGQIQNVQNYSSNPFWNRNRQYNQGMPIPVDVTGPDLSTADCITTVSVLISAFCSTNNNCYDMQLSDVRPTVMLQLSRLPGHNYATSCMGYIDSEFDKYVRTQQNTLPNRAVPFPTGPTDINPNVINNNYNNQVPNQYAPPVPDWQQEMIKRKQELKQLQSQNGASYETLAHTDFPQTYDDLSFTERMANEAQGYEPFKDATVYHGINIEDYDDYIAKHQKQTQQETNKTTPGDKPKDNPDCEHASETIQILEQNIQTLQQCKANKTPYAECIKKLKLPPESDTTTNETNTNDNK